MSTLITKEATLTSCHDIELNFERPQKLHYKYSYLESSPLNGMVFLLHGFGAEISYMDNLREYVAREYHVLAVDVYYHCFHSRPSNGSLFEFDEIDLGFLEKYEKEYKVDFSQLTDVTYESVLDTINQRLDFLKKNNELDSDFKLMMPLSIIPKNNEYQNFGIIQATDCLNVLLELQAMPFNFKNNYATTLLGTSHGGYIAHLMAKLAPQLIDNVIDNSSYTKPMSQFFIGKEFNVNDPEYTLEYPHLNVHAFTQSLWSTKEDSPYLFTTNHYRIRDINDSLHLDILLQTNLHKVRYISYHSRYDTIADIHTKEALYANFKKQGLDASLHIIDKEESIDGKFIKNLSHGMSMSLKELAKKELPQALLFSNIKQKETPPLVYPCHTNTYTFRSQNNRFLLTLS